MWYPKATGPHTHRAGATIFLPAIILAGLALAPAVAGEPETPPVQVPKDLTEASLEELMQIEVTSVSRKGQELSHAPAAIYVITQEDIRRSGLTSVPELLRLAPGVEVARVNAHEWAISARGFNGRVANKLLVLIDGRSVYTPMLFRRLLGCPGPAGRGHRSH